MSDRLELDSNLEDAELELDAPAATSPAALLAKAGALTGSLVQRGRDRAPRLMESSMPLELPTPAASVAAAPQPAIVELAAAAAPPAPERSGWADVIFAAACCIAFFATFLFVLRF